MSTAKFLLDTNVMIGLLKNTESAHDLMNQAMCTPEAAAISLVTRVELLSYPDITPQEEAQIERQIGAMPIFGIDGAVQMHAIAIRKTHRLKFADSMVAATALANGLQLLTLDNSLAKAFAAASQITH